VSKGARFDPYALLEALERHRVGYVVIGGFARVVQGSGELTRGLDIALRCARTTYAVSRTPSKTSAPRARQLRRCGPAPRRRRSR